MPRPERPKTCQRLRQEFTTQRLRRSVQGRNGARRAYMQAWSKECAWTDEPSLRAAFERMNRGELSGRRRRRRC